MNGDSRDPEHPALAYWDDPDVLLLMSILSDLWLAGGPQCFAWIARRQLGFSADLIPRFALACLPLPGRAQWLPRAEAMCDALTGSLRLIHYGSIRELLARGVGEGYLETRGPGYWKVTEAGAHYIGKSGLLDIE